MAPSLVAEEILTEHRSALVKAMKAAGKSNGAAHSHQFEMQLRQRMLAELHSHTERAGTSHKHYWERLHRHATPEDLAALIEESRTHADAKEAAEKRGRDEQGNMDGHLAAVEDHQLDDGQFGLVQPEQSSVDRNSPEIGLRVARLLGYFRGQPLGIEAKHRERDEYAIMTPDPENTEGARVIVFGPRGVTSQSSHASRGEALSRMAAAGYTEPAPGSYAEQSESEDWDWLHRWAQTASSGDETALRRFSANRTHPSARAKRRADADRTSRHRDELTAAVNNVIGTE